jgi:ketosteroid isomerase-like protein
MRKEEQNIQVVKRLFEAFSKGDIQGALNTFAENVDFQSPVTRHAEPQISWAKPRHSPGEVAAFFKEMAEKMQVRSMEPIEFTAQGDRVAVEGKNTGIVKSTGRSYEHDWAMVFTIRDGKIVRHRHYYDTADLLFAFRSDES